MTDADLKIQTLSLGLRPYAEVWELQRARQRDLIDGKAPEALIVCEHLPVITFGRSARAENLLVTREQLAEQGIDVFEVERGGDITYHGPGQLVAYPILDLKLRKRDVGWYMRQLEEVVLRSLLDFGVTGRRVPGKTGVWIPQPNEREPKKKIASLGVRISRWCTMHGIAVNVSDRDQALTLQNGFALIHPCGFSDVSMSSVAQECPGAVSVAAFQARFLLHFAEVFSLPAIRCADAA